MNSSRTRDLASYGSVGSLFGIRANTSHVGWSFGQTATEIGQAEWDQMLLRPTFEVVDALRPGSKVLGRYHYWAYCEDGSLRYERPFARNVKLQLEVSGIGTDSPRIQASSSFVRFVRPKINNLHAPRFVATDLVGATMTLKGWTPLHCSAFALDGKCVVIIAPPDSGKTWATMDAVGRLGAKFICEDIGFTDGVTLVGCPWTSTFRHDAEIPSSLFTRTHQSLRKSFAPLGLLSMPSNDKVTRLIDVDQIDERSKISHMLIIDRSVGGLSDVETVRAKSALRGLNRYEFGYARSPMLLAASYFEPNGLDPIQAGEEELRILDELASNVPTVRMSSDNPLEYPDLMDEFLATI